MVSDITIGENLQKIRNANGFTQDSVAKFIGVKREMISYYESGTREVPLEVLSKLSDLYGFELSDLFEENQEVLNENIAYAFRTDGFDDRDLDSIAEFKAIVKSYIKINKLLGR